MNKRHSKSSIMLLEIMINLCFFSVVIAICLVLLFRAYDISKRSTSTNHGITILNSMAATWQSCKGDGLQTAELLGGTLISKDDDINQDADGNFIVVCYAYPPKADINIYYNRDFQVISNKEDAAFVATLTYTCGDISIAHLSFCQFKNDGDTEELYAMESSFHEANPVSYAKDTANDSDSKAETEYDAPVIGKNPMIGLYNNSKTREVSP